LRNSGGPNVLDSCSCAAAGAANGAAKRASIILRWGYGMEIGAVLEQRPLPYFPSRPSSTFVGARVELGTLRPRLAADDVGASTTRL
jgi:hypothetical protein